MSNPPAGWYPDPTGQPNTIRWWNGTQWTNKTEKETDSADSGDAAGTAESGTATARTADKKDSGTPSGAGATSKGAGPTATTSGGTSTGAGAASGSTAGASAAGSAAATGASAGTTGGDGDGSDAVGEPQAPQEKTPPWSGGATTWTQPGDEEAEAVSASRTAQATAQSASAEPQGAGASPTDASPAKKTQTAAGPTTTAPGDAAQSGAAQSGSAQPEPTQPGPAQSGPAQSGPSPADSSQPLAAQGAIWSEAAQAGTAAQTGAPDQARNQTAQQTGAPDQGWNQTGQQTGVPDQGWSQADQGGAQAAWGPTAGAGWDQSAAQPPLSPPMQRGERSSKESKGSKLPLIIGAAVVLVLVIVAGVWSVFGRGEPEAGRGNDPTTGPTVTSPTPTGGTPTTPAPTGGQSIPPGQSRNPQLHQGNRLASDAISFPRLRPPWSDRIRFVPQVQNSTGQRVLLQSRFDGKNDWYANIFVGALSTAVLFNGDPQASASDLALQLRSSLYGDIPITAKVTRNGAVTRSGKQGWSVQQTITGTNPELTSPTLLLTVAVFDLGDGTAVAYVSDIPTNRNDLKVFESLVYKAVNVG